MFPSPSALSPQWRTSLAEARDQAYSGSLVLPWEGDPKTGGSTTMQRLTRAHWSRGLMRRGRQVSFVPLWSPQLAPLPTDSCLANAGLSEHKLTKRENVKPFFQSEITFKKLPCKGGLEKTIFLKILQPSFGYYITDFSRWRLCPSSTLPGNSQSTMSDGTLN